MGAVGVGELEDEAGLADAGLADEGDDLAVALAARARAPAKLLHLGVAADEAGQPARRGCLEPRPRRR